MSIRLHVYWFKPRYECRRLDPVDLSDLNVHDLNSVRRASAELHRPASVGSMDTLIIFAVTMLLAVLTVFDVGIFVFVMDGDRTPGS